MHAKLVAVGTYGDVLPLIAIGAELKRRGHTVQLGAPAPFEKFAKQAGVPFQVLGTADDYEAFIAEPQLWRPWRGVKAVFRFAAAMVEPAYRWIEATARAGDTIIVASTLGIGGNVAQDKLKLPLVMVHVMPVILESRHEPPSLPGLPVPAFLPPRFKHWLGRGADKFVIGPSTLPVLNALRARLELGPVRRLRYWWNRTDRIVLMFPRWYAPPQPDWPENAVQVGFPIADRLGDTPELSPELAGFLDAGDPPLVFSYGSGMRDSRAFFETALKLCQRMNRRGVLLAPQQGQVPAVLPDSVLYARYAPLSRLLPRSAAMIHHGGVGTVAQGLIAGVPQLVVPVAFNHFDEVRRLKRLGVGTALSRRRFTPARAARAIGALLGDPQVAAACAAAKAHMLAENGAAEACDAIEQTFAATTRKPQSADARQAA